MAVASVGALVTFLVAGIPLLLAYDLRGFAIGVALQGLVHLAFRAYYLQCLFEGFGFLRHACRAFLPTIPAVAVVLALRVLEPYDRSLEIALGELALYTLVTLVATWYLESPLLREAAGYLTARRPARA
jgi:hypothetical protein